MVPNKVKEVLERQHYKIVGKHSAVQICRWAKKSIRDEGVCYKERFYGIKSHLCCQMTPSVMWCHNRCLHCWRATELTLGEKLEGEIDSPKKIKELKRKKQLPTQLYVSVNTPNQELYYKFHRSSKKDAWERLNETLRIISKLKCRTVIRITLVKDLNMIKPENYAKLIKKANPMFVEIKSYMAVGFARKRLGYDRMPWHKDIVEFAEKIIRELKKIGVEMKILDEQEVSRVVVLGKNKSDLKIKHGRFRFYSHAENSQIHNSFFC